MPDLNHNDPPPLPTSGGWNPAVTYEVVIDFDPSVARKVIFLKTWQKEVPTPPDTELPVEPAPPAGAGEFLHHVGIEKDCYILIWLSKNVDWHWHRTRAITIARNDLGDQYFKLEYLTATGWKSPASPGVKTRCIRLGARFRGGMVTQEDLFNLNVELENPDKSILPITIDPDIQNPKV